MIALADVNNLKCRIVVDILDYFNCKKTILKPGLNKIRAFLFLYASYLNNCLTEEEECRIKTLVLLDCATDDTLTCDKQIKTVITQVPIQCNVGMKLIDNYPTYTINGKEINAFTFMKFTNSCIPPPVDYLVEGGCNATVCNDSLKGSYSIDHTIDVTDTTYPFPYSTSHVSAIRLYRTDASGAVISNTDYDLRVGISPYYTNDAVLCPLCTTVNPSNALITSPNFSAAFTTLLNNITSVVFGDTLSHHDITASFVAPNLKFVQKAHHLGNLKLGISTPDLNVNLYSIPGSESIIFRPADDIKVHVVNSIKFYSYPFINTISCGVVRPLVPYQTITPDVNTTLSNFNFISLPNKTTTALSFTKAPVSCSHWRLCGINTTFSPVAYQQWTRSYDTVITASNCVQAKQTGIYYYDVTLQNGCTKQTILTIPSLPNTLPVPLVVDIL